ncbi:hypothetical protein [Planosporangium thailandense]|uniref:hypothetical protein n=1 Tax=Planosporangium thailandense TaxID=765197 RepID=UPI00197BD48F|nr:hypothetical protein [Planosporangium thailandense]
MDYAISVLVGLAGAAVVILTAMSAAMTFVVPRGTPLLITRLVFVTVRAGFRLRLRGVHDYRRRDRTMAVFAPTTLLALPLVWVILVLVGFTAIYHVIGERTWRGAFLESGSSMFMLGFRFPPNLPAGLVEMTEAGFGLSLIALLIAYLPTIYTTYSRRELLVTALETEAGTPPWAVTLLVRLARIEGMPLLDTYWRDWTHWFNDIEETHSTTPMLVFFRSPAPERSWVNAAGTILDSAALVSSTLESHRHHQARAELCLRAGYLALRRIGDYFVMPYDPDPRPDDPISVRREEFDAACARLVDAGAKLRDDRDQAWRDFVGWRVTYEPLLLRFASLCIAPYAPWSGDRPIEFHRLPVSRRRARSMLHGPRRHHEWSEPDSATRTDAPPPLP